jgi:hypothetical protein
MEQNMQDNADRNSYVTRLENGTLFYLRVIGITPLQHPEIATQKVA